jgi:hypothetical protein
MKKLMLGIVAAFALSTFAAPAFAEGEGGGEEKPAKKKGGKKKKAEGEGGGDAEKK